MYKIKELIHIFKNNGDLIISTEHLDFQENSIIENGTERAELVDFIFDNSDVIFKKESPIAFSNADLDTYLKQKNINHLVVVGFNSEYCCLFTSIASVDRGYKTTLIEDATATVNTPETYEMKNLDIRDFVGCILDWSGIVEVLYFDEYIQKYE